MNKQHENINNDVITVTAKTTFDSKGNEREREQREQTLNIDYNGVSREELIKRAAKYDRIQYQRSARTSFDDVETFHTFMDNNETYDVHANDVGKKIETRETRIANVVNSLIALGYTRADAEQMLREQQKQQTS